MGIFAMNGKEPKRPLLYLSAFLPIGMAGSAIYFALKIALSGAYSHMIMPIFACLIALSASFISFKVLRNGEESNDADSVYHGVCGKLTLAQIGLLQLHIHRYR